MAGDTKLIDMRQHHVDQLHLQWAEHGPQAKGDFRLVVELLEPSRKCHLERRGHSVTHNGWQPAPIQRIHEPILSARSPGQLPEVGVVAIEILDLAVVADDQQVVADKANPHILVFAGLIPARLGFDFNQFPAFGIFTENLTDRFQQLLAIFRRNADYKGCLRDKDRCESFEQKLPGVVRKLID